MPQIKWKDAPASVKRQQVSKDPGVKRARGTLKGLGEARQKMKKYGPMPRVVPNAKSKPRLV